MGLPSRGKVGLVLLVSGGVESATFRIAPAISESKESLMTMAAERSSVQQVDIATAGLDVKSLRSIELASGWKNVKDCQITQFAVGQAHSPISLTKVYPSLQYTDQSGRTVFTPLRNVLSFSQEQSR